MEHYNNQHNNQIINILQWVNHFNNNNLEMLKIQWNE